MAQILKITDEKFREEVIFEGKGGDCAIKNPKKILEFWNKGWTECDLLIIRFDSKIKYSETKPLIHVVIHNKKINKIIDVSNGKIAMIDSNSYLDKDYVFFMDYCERGYIHSYNRISYKNFKLSMKYIEEKENKDIQEYMILNLIINRLWDELSK